MFDNANNPPAGGQNNGSNLNNPPDAGGSFNSDANPGAGSKIITDMYADIERPEKPDAFKPKQTLNQSNPGYDNIPPEMLAGNSGAKQKVFTLLIVIIGMAMLGTGGYYGFKFYKKSFAPRTDIVVPENIVNDDQAKTENNKPPVIEAVVTPPAPQPTEPITPPITEPIATTEGTIATTTIPAPVANIDTDQDGLTDAEEAALATSPTNVDSDADGLSDREEAKVYKTNPLNADTDSDSFNDGDEVKKGYNPNGAGKLYDINNQSAIQ